MAEIPYNQILSKTKAHIANTENPHKTHHTRIWGLDRLDNVPDMQKMVSQKLDDALEKKMDIASIYNSTEIDNTVDMTVLPWSASQGKIMMDTITAFNTGDTSDLEARIAKCEKDV